MSLRQWLTTIIVLPLALLVCVTTALFFLAQTTRQAESNAEHVSELYSEVSELATSLLEVESRARTYAITPDASNLNAYLGSRQNAEFQIAQLHAQPPRQSDLGLQISELERLAGNALAGLDRHSATGPIMSEFSTAQKHFADVAYGIREQELSGLTRLWNISLAVLAFAALCGLLITIGLAFMARRHLARRIERVERGARLYTSGQDITGIPPVGGHDEIARLDEAFRTMASTIAERETQLRLALRQAEAASDAKSAFVATVSHELRTPLNGVIGMSELLMEAPLTALEHEYATTIHTSSQSLLGIINGILDFSTFSASAPSLHIAEVHLESLVHSVAALFAAQLAEKGLILNVTLGANVPSVIFADELRLRQILANIVGNAVKFTPAGSISVSVSSRDQGAGTTLVTFEISDTGIGIVESMRETIFDPFRQGDMSTTRNFGGTGLGLSISRQLVTLMGGTIVVGNAKGAGSTFSVAIPFQTKPGGAARPHIPPPASPTPSEPRSESVLLVEDNEINQRVALRLLQRLGFHAHIAVNGREALDALERAHYDLIFMDLQMPVMDGFDASAEVRRRETRSGAHIPIVAMTANALPEDREACFAVGMDDHVAKPVTLAELRRVVDRWLPESTNA